MKKIYILSDAHFEENFFLDEFLEKLKTNPFEKATHFIILGDLFKFFIGIKKWISKKQMEVLNCFLDLKKKGIFFVYIEGNRDFFLEKKFLFSFFNFIGELYELSLNSDKFLFLHGDKINKKDKAYFLWNKVSKSFLVYFLTKYFPKKMLLPFYSILEKKLSEKTFKYKKEIPYEEIKEFGDSFKGYYKKIFIGHFHREDLIFAENTEIILLPAYKDKKEFFIFEYGV